MKMTALGKQLQYFIRHRELPGICKKPLDDPSEAEDIADYAFKRVRHNDNDPRDYHPLYRDIFRWNSGETSDAQFSITKEERHLERTDILYRRREILHVHENAEVLEVFKAISYRGEHHWLDCYRLDKRNPENSFWQEVTLPPDSRVG